ncbi:MAG TPA: hypothetical protein VN446_04740 [Candidatus Acidoferrum sp.]|nr:hypothetical protein [Candidatus Acidoferrum sp.]
MIKKLKADSRGQTIVIVLVTMLFLSILGASVLFSSYTGFMMKVTGRRGAQNFYDAEAAVNEIRVGVQQVASDAISSAYTAILVDYDKAVNTPDDTEDIFRTYFRDALLEWKDADDDELLHYSVMGGYSYDPDVLKKFLLHPEGAEILGTGEVTVGTEGVTIHGLKVTYREDGYESTVGTDICINYPDFSYTLSELILTAVPDFTVIAKDQLRQDSGGTIIVDGNAYAGSITVAGSNTMQIGTAQNFICRGKLTAENGATFRSNSYSSLWTGRIELVGGVGSAIILSGDTYVADDLELAGNNARAELAGRYFGFGNSLVDPAKSSSIIVSGHDTELSLTGLSNLMLTGSSFITAGTGNNVLMGESVSVKSDQLAYLIPAKCIGSVSTNPAIFNNDAIPSVATLKGYVNTGYTLWAGRTLGYYIDDVQLAMYPVGGQTLVYFYMEFGSREKANEYFKDYFSRNQTEIEKYIDVYSDGISFFPSQPRTIAGGLVTYEQDDGDEVGDAGLVDASAVVSPSTPARLTTMFTNLCSTLSTNMAADDPGISVYDYIVDDDAMARITGDTYFYQENDDDFDEPVALIVDHEYTVNSTTPGSIKVIVATGNITLRKDNFTGLLISGGNIYLEKSAEADHIGVSAAFQGIATVGGTGMTLLDFLKISTSANQSFAGGAGINWNLERLVTYDNWTKS